MAAATPQDVKEAIEGVYRGKLDLMKVYVTIFEALQTYPLKFVYRGYTIKEEDAFLC
jgi:hypothetical protein